MSGIAGVVTFACASQWPVAEMIRAIAHRGPEQTEYCREGSVQFAVCGPSQDKLIARNGNETVICGFSGVLYNIPSLIERFLGGRHFPGYCSPAELIPYLYEKIGSEFLEHLEGQFALVLYDKVEKIVILARDSVGACPLYYAVSGNSLFFGSEIKAIFMSRAIEIRPNVRALYENFVYWSTSDGKTVFQDVYQIPPACSAVLDYKRRVRIQQYRWHGDGGLPTVKKSPAELQAELRAALTQSIQDCLAGGGKWGLYLSGGLDSSILLRLAAEMGYTDAPVFSLGFADSAVDESPYQALAMEGHEGKHHRIRVEDGDIIAVLPQVLRHCETPLFKLGPAPMFLLSRAAGLQGVKFILSGEGADELFYGYDLFKETKFRISWAENPDAGRDIVHIVPPQFRSNPYMLEMYRNFYSRYLKAGDALYCMRPRIDASSEIIKYFTPENQALIDAREIDNLMARQFSPDQSALRQCQAVQMRLLLPGYLLSVQGDRVLMANSVQGRFPFLHPRMILLSMAIPDSLKLHGYQEKHILKEAFADILPPAILRREKYQYSAPSGGMLLKFEDELGAYWSKEIFQCMGIFDYNAFQSLFQSFQAESQHRHLNLTQEMILTYIVTVHMLFALAKDEFAKRL